MNDDRAMVDAVLEGRRGAFEALVRAHQGLCWHIIERIVRHPEDARELCQETFLRVHRKLHQYRGESALKTWIGRIAYSLALRHLEKKRLPGVAMGDDDEAPWEQIPDPALIDHNYERLQSGQALHRAIEALPAVPRTVLTLYHLDELGIDQISRITGLATGTIKSHLFRSRRQLRALLESTLGVSA
ncbi:sigma-70 family RNA polymerase sigma factor [Oleiagrimonas sp. C23AA]|uniref:RNA polymerase sigma factor n=1 Tax=Oleiagrimonas sp. C23AA TaxID=2719047 RepID=UPI00141FE36A|nr:sigma-70 family RNA polymerase sigma factor [Oleiagrimonas sp. C23AA]NII11916.1 sigma-70 family RNA polymerase sigma factor [Oleiagrimonas sp. C23AA]